MNYNDFAEKNKETLQTASAEFLTLFEPYDWFVTHTFRLPPTEKKAYQLYNRWMRKLNESIYGRRYREKQIGLIHAHTLEYQKRDAIHFHSLIRGVPEHYSRKNWAQMFMNSDKTGCSGFVDIQPYDPTRNAKGYLSKYISKGGEVEIFVPTKIASLPKVYIGHDITSDRPLSSKCDNALEEVQTSLNLASGVPGI